VDTKTYISTGIIEEYALGVLPKDDASILECIMKNNLEVRNVVLEAQKTFELLADSQAVEAPNHLKAEIFSKLSFEKKYSALEIKNSNDNTDNQVPIIATNNKKSGTLSKILLMAASLLLFLSLGFDFYNSNEHKKSLELIALDNSQLKSQISELKTTNQVMANSTKIKLEGVPKHPGMLADVYIDYQNNCYLILNNLPKAPEGMEYQLWMIADGKSTDCGTYNQGSETSLQAMKPMTQMEHKSQMYYAVTLEKKGGSERPTMDAIFVMGAA
jgi:anti-sigma-K factor RskA